MEMVGDDENTESTHYDVSTSKRRTIRSNYRELGNRVNEGKDDIADSSSQKFMAIMTEVDNLHQHVMKPREQVADAEAFLGLTNILMASVKSHSLAIHPAEFISILIRDFGRHKKCKGFYNASPNVSWSILGSRVSPIFMKGTGCRTMNGPMENELKWKKPAVRAKRTRSSMKTLPTELKTTIEMVSNTHQNIHVMFEILKRKKTVKLESLILNRDSFAQTVENLFALSFLVKDGRVHIGVDEAGSQVVAPRNGPSAAEIKSGAARSHHFVFKLDFDDWKLMKMLVREGDEVMPQRYAFEMRSCCARDLDTPEAITT